jgi:hypothetical protein
MTDRWGLAHCLHNKPQMDKNVMSTCGLSYQNCYGIPGPARHADSGMTFRMAIVTWKSL